MKHVELWCSGPTCLPVTQETAGSNPVSSAILLNQAQRLGSSVGRAED